MNLTPINLEDELKALGQAYGNDLAKDKAKTRVRRLYNEATILEEQYTALREVAGEMARDNVSLRLENEALKNAGQAVITPEHFWNLETAILNGVREIFSERSEPAYQPVVKTEKPAAYYISTNSFIEDYIDIRPVESARDNWYEAECFYKHPGDLNWTTTGSESVVEDAAHEHAQKHLDDAKGA
jgi:hypothetical protein